jgi:hypothetical protein
MILEVNRSSQFDIAKSQSNVPDGMLRVKGVLAVVETMNRNNRYYTASNYSTMIKDMQNRIVEEKGILGEMEHPKSMNIDLHNASHIIEEIAFNESTGEVTGTILLMDTPTGKIAQSVVKTGKPLPISSRAMGRIQENKEVVLEYVSTFDLVGTAGFKQANVMVAESLSLDNGDKVDFIVYECDDSGRVLEANQSGLNESDIKRLINEAVKDIKPEATQLNENAIDESQILNIVKKYVLEEAAPEIRKFVEDAECEKDEEELTEAQLARVQALVDQRFVETYATIIQEWVTGEFRPVIENWCTNDLANGIQKWVTEEFAPVIQNWVVEDFAPEVEGWVNEEFAPIVEKWAMNDLAKGIQDWMVNEYATGVQKWATENFVQITEGKDDAEDKAQKSKGSEKSEDQKLDAEIADDSDEHDSKPDEKGKKVEEAAEETTMKETEKESEKVEEAAVPTKRSLVLAQIDEQFKDADQAPKAVQKPVIEERSDINEELKAAPYWLRNMPKNYVPIWEGLTKVQKNNIARRANLRVFESLKNVNEFWDGLDWSPIVKQYAKSNERAMSINEDAQPKINANMQKLSILAKSLRQ